MGTDFHRRTLQTRLLVLIIIIISIFVVYLVKLFSMQVVNLNFYQNRADNVTKRSVIIPSKRGLIYDRTKSTILATNEDTFVLTLNPEGKSLSQIVGVLQKVASYNNSDLKQLIKKLPSAAKLYQPVDLLTNVPFSVITKIAEHYEDFPGITWQSKPRRVYPLGKSIAQALGFVGEINEDELKVYFNKGYNKRSVVGKAGVEYNFDQVLRGKEGLKYKRVDAQGKNISSKDLVTPPELGKNLILSIDGKIQTLVAKSLGKRVGSAIVMKPATGEVLAMVSYPNFDPNLFYTDQAQEVFSNLAKNSYGPFLNRAIQASASPASAFKVLMSTALLEEGVISPSKTILCTGNIMIGNRKFNCHVLTGHGYVDLYDALAESCNVYFYTAGTQYLGVDTIVDYCYRYGFGEITQIDLPSELPGLVPTPEWKLDVKKTPWVGGDTANFSIGQGDLQVTPIQLAEMVSMIVNEGVSYQPRVVTAIEDPITHEKIQEFPKKVLKQITLKPETWKNLKTAMRGVIVSGTAAPVITTKAVQIAGKTGTAQTGGGEDDKHSWFIAYGPYDAKDPNDVVAVVVWVDAVNPWEWWAPKAANMIFHGIFANKNYEETVSELNAWYLSKPESFE